MPYRSAQSSVWFRVHLSFGINIFFQHQLKNFKRQGGYIPLLLRCMPWPHLPWGPQADEPDENVSIVWPFCILSHRSLETPYHTLFLQLPIPNKSKLHGENLATFSFYLPKKKKKTNTEKKEFTWMVRTMRLVSSRAAIAVEVPNEAVPRWNPRTIRPSLRYCSIGSHTRSLMPWTTH